MTLRLSTLPLSTNNLYANARRGRFLTPKGRDNKEEMAWDARNQFHGEPLEGPLKVSVDLFWPTKRNHDIDNIKALLDALTGIVWNDDGQIVELRTRKFYDKDNPHVDLEVLPAMLD